VRNLSNIGLTSAYHLQNGEEQGNEEQPTFHMYRKRDKRYHYHIDYAFASEDIIQSTSISIGKANEWLDSSDHMPVILDIATGYR
jgi:exonuclease III